MRYDFISDYMLENFNGMILYGLEAGMRYGQAVLFIRYMYRYLEELDQRITRSTDLFNALLRLQGDCGAPAGPQMHRVS